MSQLGKAYIEVIADLKKFPADLRTKLKAALTQAIEGVEFSGLEVKAKEAGANAAEAAGQSFERRSKERLGRAGEAGGRSLLGGLRRIFTRDSGEGRGFFGGITNFFGGIVGAAKDAASQAGSSLASVGSSVTGGLGSVFGGGGDVTSLLKFGAIAALIPVALGLAGALYQLGAALFALPAATGVVIGAFVPLIIAFQGFGEAVGAGLSGDVDKFNEALKGLPPSMRSVVREVVGLKGLFTGIRTSIQEAFFRPLVGVVGPAIRSFLSTVTPGLTRTASALGNVGATLLRTFSSPANLQTFTALLDTTARIVQTMEPTLANLAQGFLNLVKPALPFLERGATAFRDIAARFEAFTRRISSDGTLSGWLERAANIGRKLIELFKQAGKFVGTILDSLGDEGTDTIRGLGDAFRQLNEYLQSDSGKEFLHNLGVLVHWAGNLVVDFIATLKVSFIALNLVFDAVRALGRGLQTLGGWVVSAAKAVGSFFAMLWGWITGAGRAIAGFFTDTIPSWFESVVNFFRGLPDRVVEALSGFRDAGRNFIVDALRSWYEQVFEWVGNIIGIFLSLPQLIPAAFDVLAQKLSELWTSIWNGAVNLFWFGVNSILAIINGIPGLLATIWENVRGFFVGLWNDVVVASYDAVVGGFNKMIDFFFSLPGRVRALGPALYNAAVSLGHRIGDGLANIGNFASDIGRRIVNTIKNGINFVIGSINNGIAEIDDRLPGTLPRIPLLARGAVVDTPTLALVGEAGPEVVVPLGNRKRAQELAEQSGLLSMLRNVGGQAMTKVIVYLDPSGVLIPTVKTVVDQTLDDQGDELSYARAA